MHHMNNIIDALITGLIIQAQALSLQLNQQARKCVLTTLGLLLGE